MNEPRLFAVFGKPILHSKSPHMFNSVFERLDSRDYYIRVRPSSAADIIRMIKTVPISGASITAPYKEEVIPFLDELSEESQAIGAVNQIVNDNGCLKGYNTDHLGVSNSLAEAGFRMREKNCLILGAGGAAKSVAYALKKHGAEVFVFNRTASRAESIADKFGCRVIKRDSVPEKEHFDLVVSTLPPDAMPLFFRQIRFDLLLDANYKPSWISQEANGRAVQLIDGKRWLLHQAHGAFKLFTGSSVSINWMEEGLSRELNKGELRILFQEDPKTDVLLKEKPDMILSAAGLSSEEKQLIIDEEIDKAFES